jgi:hypothetical protein
LSARQSLVWQRFGGHTLGPVITEPEQQTGVETRRIHVDKRYRGHNHKQKFRVWIGGQVRRGTKPIGREMRRRAAVEAVIGHAKAEHRMGIWRRATAIGSMPCSWLQGIFPPPPALAGKVFCAIYSRRSSHQSRTPNHPETAARRFFPHSLIIQDLPNLGRKI